ncbi:MULTISPECIES: IclR family transcriptional regulator [unclassified Bordetella]|uniref:IclR family transcriptional regulator n=1 Tax=unclassified Bordetella TaxID=2630031 RepID=UPI001327C7A1|nr:MULTISPECIES: IclR family transcriptional regulator [unclassified Bordetella]MVW70056.1 helix-turn-helix domain-containing protein [Bordetella sp. 15P40C-2]MVW78266.1 helix-turn-helix domain-containing protein [Bordetella sp. 02P26C-1]
MRTNERAGVKSAERVLDILELFSATAGVMKLSDIARRLGMPKSSTSALLATLVDRGYVDSGVDGYQMAARYRTTGWVGGRFARLIRIAHPTMAELSESVKESVFLGVLNEREMVQYLTKVVSTEPLRYDVDLAKERHAYATTIGQVILADRTQEQIEHYLTRQPLTPLTPKTEVDVPRLMEQISRVREQGYAELSDTHLLGVSGISVPVRDENGRVVAGLCTFGPSPRMAENWEAIRAAVLRAGKRITADLALTAQ